MDYNKRLLIFIVFVLVAITLVNFTTNLFLSFTANKYIVYYQVDTLKIRDFFRKNLIRSAVSNEQELIDATCQKIYQQNVSENLPSVIIYYNEHNEVAHISSSELKSQHAQSELIAELKKKLRDKSVYTSNKRGWVFFKFFLYPNFRANLPDNAILTNPSVLIGFENASYQKQILFIKKTLLMASLSFITLLSPIFFSPLLLLGGRYKNQTKYKSKRKKSTPSSYDKNNSRQPHFRILSTQSIKSLVELKEKFLAIHLEKNSEEISVKPPNLRRFRSHNDIIHYTQILNQCFNQDHVKQALREITNISFNHQKKMPLDYKTLSKMHLMLIENLYPDAISIKLFLKREKPDCYYLIAESDLEMMYFYQEKDLIQEYFYADLGIAGKAIAQNLPYQLNTEQKQTLFLPFSFAKNFSPKRSQPHLFKNKLSYQPYGILELQLKKLPTPSLQLNSQDDNITQVDVKFSHQEIDFLNYLLEYFADNYENQNLIFKGYLERKTHLFDKKCFQYNLNLLYCNDYLVLNEAFCLVILTATVKQKKLEKNSEHNHIHVANLPESFLIDCMSEHLKLYRSKNVQIFYLENKKREFALLIQESKEIWSEILQEIVIDLEKKSFSYEDNQLYLTVNVGIADKTSQLPQPTMLLNQAKRDLELHQQKISHS